jgi:hypothetical protein
MKNILRSILGSFILATVAGAQVPGIINYQGRVVDAGTNFDGTGQFTFALLAATNVAQQATATANLGGQFVISYNVTTAGFGYTTPPIVTISGGGGSGASATSSISGGVVVNITAVSAGSGYTSPPTVTLAAPPAAFVYTPLWSNGVNNVSLPVTKGLYSVLLGDTTVPNMGSSIPAAAFTNNDVVLRVSFNDGIHGLQQLSPDQRLGTVGYSMNAAMAQTAVNIVPTSDVAGQRLNIGIGNILSGSLATIAGGSNNTAGGIEATIGGGLNNTANGFATTVGGGDGNSASNFWSTVGGGLDNVAGLNHATVGGGHQNTASGFAATIGGGQDNIASNIEATVGGGDGNVSGGNDATVGGGVGNLAGGNDATIGGGADNVAKGLAAAVPGGEDNVAGGTFSFAAGQQAEALHQGAFVWGDSQGAVFASTANDQFLIRAQGGVGIGTNAPAGELHVASSTSGTPQICIDQQNSSNFSRLQMGVVSFPHWIISVEPSTTPSLRFFNGTTDRMIVDYSGNVTATSFNPTSDRNAKQGFSAVDDQEILSRLMSVPIQTWSFKQDAHTRHIGPMAQDFYTAFSVGADDRHIATVDADGIAFAAIQGLNQKLEQQAGRMKEKESEIAELRRELQELKAEMHSGRKQD